MPVASTRPRYPELAAAISRTGLTFTQLSHRVNCNAQYIGQIVRGHGTPSASLRARFAEVLGVPETELFAEPVSVFGWSEDDYQAALDQLRRNPAPPLTDQQKKTIVSVFRAHLAEQQDGGHDDAA